MAKYFVAEHLKRGIAGAFGFYDACDHRHKTLSGAKRCATALNGKEKREGNPRGYWSVGARLSRGGNAPARLPAPTGVPSTVSGEV